MENIGFFTGKCKLNMMILFSLATFFFLPVTVNAAPSQSSTPIILPASSVSTDPNKYILPKPNEDIIPLKIKRKQRIYDSNNLIINKKNLRKSIKTSSSTSLIIPTPNNNKYISCNDIILASTLLISPSSSSSSQTTTTVTSSILSSSFLSNYSFAFTGICTDTWNDLQSIIRPTQYHVGYSWIHYKLLKDFGTKRLGQIALDNSLTPAILGPTDDGTLAIYIIDDHHTFSALDYSGYSNIMVTINVICDLRNLTVQNFWEYLHQHQYTLLMQYPKNKNNQFDYISQLPIPLAYSDLPTNITFRPYQKTLQDDPWRSLVGFSRKIKDVPKDILLYYNLSIDNSNSNCTINNKYCYRCFYRGCNKNGNNAQGPSVPFFEFRWSYFLLDSYIHPQLWPSITMYTIFKEKLHNLLLSSSSNNNNNLIKINLENWFNMVPYLLPLCHAETNRNYRLPSNIFADHYSLPGYTNNIIINSNDAVCDQPEKCLSLPSHYPL